MYLHNYTVCNKNKKLIVIVDIRYKNNKKFQNISIAVMKL